MVALLLFSHILNINKSTSKTTNTGKNNPVTGAAGLKKNDFKNKNSNVVKSTSHALEVTGATTHSQVASTLLKNPALSKI